MIAVLMMAKLSRIRNRIILCTNSKKDFSTYMYRRKKEQTFTRSALEGLTSSTLLLKFFPTDPTCDLNSTHAMRCFFGETIKNPML